MSNLDLLIYIKYPYVKGGDIMISFESKKVAEMYTEFVQISNGELTLKAINDTTITEEMMENYLAFAYMVYDPPTNTSQPQIHKGDGAKIILECFTCTYLIKTCCPCLRSYLMRTVGDSNTLFKSNGFFFTIWSK